MKRKERNTKLIVIAAVIALAICLATLIAACTPTTGGGDDTGGGQTTSYTLYFEGEVVDIDPIELTTGAVSLPTPEERRGYTFAGWYIDEEYTTTLIDYFRGHDVNGNVTAYAKWELVDYTLRVTVNNPHAGAFTVGDSREALDDYTASFNIGERFALTAAASDPDNYSFDGWYLYGAGGYTRVDSGETYTFTAAAENVTLEARWTGGDRSAIFYRNYSAFDTTVVEMIDFRYGDSFTVSPGVRTDYMFTGWYSDSACTGTPVAGADGEFEIYEPAEESVSLYAGWTRRDHTLSFDAGAVTGYDPVTAGGILHIPSAYDGVIVSGINSGAFSGYDGCIVVPGSVTEIEAGAFDTETTVLFDADHSPDKLSALTGTASADGAAVYVHLALSYLNDVSEYGCYIESNGAIYDTVIGSREEFEAVMGYCWLYNIGTYTANDNISVSFDFSESGIQSGSLQETVFGINGSGGWVSEIFARLGLKSDTASSYTYSASEASMSVTVNFSTRTDGNYVATDDTLSLTPDYLRQDEAVQIISGVGNFGAERSFAIDSRPEYLVYNSEQLVYAVERGFRPRFGTLSANAPEYQKEALAGAVEVYDRARAALADITDPDASEVEKLLAIHDYIAENVVYDMTLLDMSTRYSAEQLSGYRAFNLEGVFIDGYAVCDGIAKAFMLMARIEGIETIRVSGYLTSSSGTVGHAWNKVKIDGAWYVVDVTGDDMQVPVDADEVEIICHDRFLVSDAYIFANGYDEDDYGYPVARGEYYYYPSVTLEALGSAFENVTAVFTSSDELQSAVDAARAAAEDIFAADPEAEYVTFEFYWDSAADINVNMSFVRPSGNAGGEGVIVAIFIR